MMNGKACEILSAKKLASIGACQDFMDGAILQGMAVALPRHIEDFRELILKYKQNIINNINNN
jgi:hypothetical protein